MNRLTKIIAVILVLLAICLAAFAWWLGNQKPPAPVAASAAPDTVTKTYLAVAAAQKLEKGKPIAADQVKLLGLPTQTLGSFQDIDSIIGRVPTSDLDIDTLITDSNLVQGLALKLAEGERAVAIPVDEVISVGNKITAGDYVDVFFTLRQGNGINKGQARLLASRRQVLAYGATIVGEAPASGILKSGNSASQSPARTAVLATPVEQVNQLLLAAQNGKLILALRHPDDQGVADIALFSEPRHVLDIKTDLTASEREGLKTADNQAFAGIELPSWSSSGNTVRPLASTNARRAPTTRKKPTQTLEVIKGTQRETVHF